MADPVTRPDKPPAKSGGGQKIAGQPAWVWGVGLGAVVLGYLYIRSRGASSATAAKGTGEGTGTGAAAGGGGGAQTGWTTETFKVWVRDHHGHGHRKITVPPRLPPSHRKPA